LDRCSSAAAAAETDANDRTSSSHQQDIIGTRELVLVQGLSGTGKSSLVKHFVNSDRRRLQWVEGKFDFIRRQNEPLSAFVDAFQTLSTRILDQWHQKAFVDFRESLLHELDEDEIPLLLSMIPNLQQVVYKDVDQEPSTSERPAVDDLAGDPQGNSHRMKHIIRKLCRVLTHHFAPLIIVLDDMQWADKASLELVESLMNANFSLLLIVCFRSNVAEEVQTMKSRLLHSKIQGLTITDMEIGNLSLGQLHRFVSTLLSMEDEEPEKTLELAQLCYKRTHGNAFYLQQFLIMLKEEKCLEFNLGLLRWTWNTKRIESETAATANVVELVTERLSRLSPGLLSFLRIVSCLGSTFHKRAIDLAWENVATTTTYDTEEEIGNREKIDVVLDLAKEGYFLEEISSDSYRWTHDNIQEAIISTIKTEQIDSLKWRLGLTLLQYLTKDELNRENFAVANLLVTCRPESETKALALIDLFVKAAEAAASVAGFQSALRYAKAGISLLPAQNWESSSCFDKSLRLYSLATEASGFLGHADGMLTYSEVVLKQPRCSILDKIRVYLVVLQFLQNNGKAFEALKLGLEILSELGCSFPKTRAGQAIAVMRKIQKLKKNPPSVEDLRKLPFMTDQRSKEIVKVIFRLEACFYYTKQIFLYILASVRTVELVTENGLCDYSGGAFFATGNVLTAMSDDLKYIAKWSELSLLMTKLVPNGHHESRVLFCIAHGFAWGQPLHGLPREHRRGYRVGMKVGDTER
jgi:predicted ATPase